jgi:hypothetical protein
MSLRAAMRNARRATAYGIGKPVAQEPSRDMPEEPKPIDKADGPEVQNGIEEKGND